MSVKPLKVENWREAIYMSMKGFICFWCWPWFRNIIFLFDRQTKFCTLPKTRFTIAAFMTSFYVTWKDCSNLSWKPASPKEWRKREKRRSLFTIVLTNPSVELVEEMQKWQTTLPAPICPNLRYEGSKDPDPPLATFWVRMEQLHWTSIITLHANQYSVEMMIANAPAADFCYFQWNGPNSDTLRNNYFCLVFYALPQMQWDF